MKFWHCGNQIIIFFLQAGLIGAQIAALGACHHETNRNFQVEYFTEVSQRDFSRGGTGENPVVWDENFLQGIKSGHSVLGTRH